MRMTLKMYLEEKISGYCQCLGYKGLPSSLQVFKDMQLILVWRKRNIKEDDRLLALGALYRALLAAEQYCPKLLEELKWRLA